MSDAQLVRALLPHLSSLAARSGTRRWNPPCPAAEVAAFEARHEIALPEGYRALLLEAGNGGGGPGVGIFPLGEALDLEDARLRPWNLFDAGVLARPFPHLTPAGWWSAGEEAQEEAGGEPGEPVDDFAGADEPADGALLAGPPDGAFLFAYLGCNTWEWLVITGPERGRVWEWDGNLVGPFGSFQPVPNPLLRSIEFGEWLALWAAAELGVPWSELLARR